MIQWLGLHASTAGGTGLIPSQGTKITQGIWLGKKKKKKQTFLIILPNFKLIFVVAHIDHVCMHMHA